jgi:predicted RecA/RadA family phage recombinase
MGGFTGGVPVMFGALCGVPEFTAAQGDTCSLTVVGVHRLPKANGELQAGAVAYLDDATHQIGATGAGKFPVGVVVELAAAPDTSALVRLNGVAATAVAGG